MEFTIYVHNVIDRSHLNIKNFDKIKFVLVLNNAIAIKIYIPSCASKHIYNSSQPPTKQPTNPENHIKQSHSTTTAKNIQSNNRNP